MDTMKLRREFVHVHQNSGEGNRLSNRVVDGLLELGRRRHCTVSVHEATGAITILCQEIGGLGGLMNICSGDEGEGPDLRFFRSLRIAIVKFIG